MQRQEDIEQINQLMDIYAAEVNNFALPCDICEVRDRHPGLNPFLYHFQLSPSRSSV